jgi:hypothetical protein
MNLPTIYDGKALMVLASASSVSQSRLSLGSSTAQVRSPKSTPNSTATRPSVPCKRVVEQFRTADKCGVGGLKRQRHSFNSRFVEGTPKIGRRIS